METLSLSLPQHIPENVSKYVVKKLRAFADTKKLVGFKYETDTGIVDLVLSRSNWNLELKYCGIQENLRPHLEKKKKLYFYTWFFFFFMCIFKNVTCSENFSQQSLWTCDVIHKNDSNATVYMPVAWLRLKVTVRRSLLVAVFHRPLSDISLDFVTGFTSSQGNAIILTVVDRFSKFARFVPQPKLPSAKETAQLVLLHDFHLHGLPPLVMMPDRWPQFTSVFWRVLQPDGSHCQPFLRIPPPVNWADWVQQPRNWDGPVLPGIPKPIFLVPAAPVGGVCLSLTNSATSHSCVLTVTSLHSFRPKRERGSLSSCRTLCSLLSLNLGPSSLRPPSLYGSIHHLSQPATQRCGSLPGTCLSW